jgi:hypothetical protein
MSTPTNRRTEISPGILQAAVVLRQELPASHDLLVEEVTVAHRAGQRGGQSLGWLRFELAGARIGIRDRVRRLFHRDQGCGPDADQYIPAYDPRHPRAKSTHSPDQRSTTWAGRRQPSCASLGRPTNARRALLSWDRTYQA